MKLARLASACIAMVLLTLALCFSPTSASAKGLNNGATTQPGHHCHKHKHKHKQTGNTGAANTQ
jgi:hypothetical protein